MAGDWIKVEHALPDKPECIRVAEILGIDQDAVVGKLIRIWVWADQQTTDGKATVSAAFIDRLAGLPGFAAALESVGWLVPKSGAIQIPRFDRHNGQTAKRRVETNRRVAEHRSGRCVIPRPLRRVVFERDKHACVYCGRKQGEYTPPETKRDAILSLDHVIPETRGGTTDERNLVACCAKCNNTKNNRTPDECGLAWPLDAAGKRFGNADVTKETLRKALPEKRREEKSSKSVVSGEPMEPIRVDSSKLGDAVMQAEVDRFLKAWNDNSHTRKVDYFGLPHHLVFARFSNPSWVEHWPKALAKFPLRGFPDPTMQIEWFLEEQTVGRILAGRWDFEAKPRQQFPGATPKPNPKPSDFIK